MKVAYDGRTDHVPFAEELSPRLAQAVREGDLYTDDGTPITGVTAQRLRHRLLGTYRHLPSRRERRSAGQRRMLIPGLWPWGTIPMLGGNPKAGKTTLVADLVTALVVPGYRFLDHFDPVEDMRFPESEAFLDRLEFQVGPGFGENDPDPDHDRARGVVLINAETPPEDFEAALGLDREVLDVDDGEPLLLGEVLKVEHLEDLGGARLFDVTDPEVFDMWVYRLAECFECDGSDDWTPYVVIVDGVTAILHGAGKGVEAYGEWYAAFRSLMRAIDVPNALAVAHNTMSGGHLMGGVEAQAGADGLWTYSSDNSDDPTSTRRFSVRPRLGGVEIPPTRVVLNEQGRPVMEASDREPSRRTVSPDPVDVAELIDAYVREHPGAHGQELTDNVDCGSKDANLDGRSKAVENGWISEQKCGHGCTLCERPHHRRVHYWPVVQFETETEG